MEIGSKAEIPRKKEKPGNNSPADETMRQVKDSESVKTRKKRDR